ARLLRTAFAVLGGTEAWISPGAGAGLPHAASSAINAAARSGKTRFKLLLLLSSLGVDDAPRRRRERTCRNVLLVTSPMARRGSTRLPYLTDVERQSRLKLSARCYRRVTELVTFGASRRSPGPTAGAKRPPRGLSQCASTTPPEQEKRPPSRSWADHLSVRVGPRPIAARVQRRAGPLDTLRSMGERRSSGRARGGASGVPGE